MRISPVNLTPMSPADRFATIVAADLRSSEHALDRSLAAYGQMLSNLAEGRVSAGLAAQAGQKGLDHIVEAISASVAARRSTIAAHDAFARDARRLGIEWTSMAAGETKPGGSGKEGVQPAGFEAEAA